MMTTKLWVCIGIMIVALIGMIICSKKQNTMPAAKVISIVLLIAIVGCFGVVIYDFVMFSSGGNPGLRANENKFYVSQAFVVGDYVKGIGGGKILIVADPSYKQDTRMNDFVAAMKKGLGGDVVVDTVELPPTNEEMAEPISERMTTKDFEATIARNSDAKVIVSLIGLPRDILKNTKLLQDCKSGKGPKIILLSSDVPSLGKMIDAGMVTAAVTVSPKAKFDETAAPSDEKAAFAVRYILVDKKNIADNKGLFGE